MEQTIKKMIDSGISLKPTMAQKTGGVFDSLVSVIYNDTEILYFRKNDDHTFNTFECLRYPSSFPKYMNNLSLEEVVEVIKSVIVNNFKNEAYS